MIPLFCHLHISAVAADICALKRSVLAHSEESNDADDQQHQLGYSCRRGGIAAILCAAVSASAPCF